MKRQICMHLGVKIDVLQMIHTRDDFLKKARRTNNSEDWGFYKTAVFIRL